MEPPILRLTEFEPARSASGPDVSLEITRGKARERRRPVSGRVFLIGTASDCDLVLGDLSFPEVYAYLFIDRRGVSIRRLGTGPELIVSGEPAERAELFHGDTVRFGPFEMRLIIRGAAVRQTSASHAESDDAWSDAPGAAEPAVLRFMPQNSIEDQAENSA
jgi:Inner membrane component of T3SS, cytoplasmic domain